MATGVTIVGMGTPAGGTGAVSPGLPAGWAAGDIHYLFHNSKRLESVTTPSGWTVFATSTPTVDNKLLIFRRVAQSGDVAPTVADSGDHGYAVILGLRGALLEEALATTQQNTPTTAASWASITTTGSERLIILAAADGLDATGQRISGVANANLTNITERQDNGITSNDGGGLVVYTADAASAGAIGATTGTYSTAASQAYAVFAVYASGPTGYTLTAASGSFGLTGIDAGLKFAHRLIADAGSFVMTGTAATLRKGRQLAAVAGSFAVAGQAAALRLARRLPAAIGAYLWTGTPAALLTSEPQTLPAEAGAFIVGAPDVTFRLNQVVVLDGIAMQAMLSDISPWGWVVDGAGSSWAATPSGSTVWTEVQDPPAADSDWVESGGE